MSKPLLEDPRALPTCAAAGRLHYGVHSPLTHGTVFDKWDRAGRKEPADHSTRTVITASFRRIFCIVRGQF